MTNAIIDVFNPTEEHKALRDTARKFGETVLEQRAAQHDEEESFDVETFRRLGSELGFFGLTVPEDRGGVGMDPTASIIVHEELSRFDPAFTLSYLAHELLFVNNFFHAGSKSQHDRYLPRVISGEWIAGMAMTEPEAGTDVLSMRTTAVL